MDNVDRASALDFREKDRSESRQDAVMKWAVFSLAIFAYVLYGILRF